MSGHTDDAVFHRGVNAQTMNFIQKPFMPKALEERLHALFNPPADHREEPPSLRTDPSGSLSS
jgi:hypothetical protein